MTPRVPSYGSRRGLRGGGERQVDEERRAAAPLAGDRDVLFISEAGRPASPLVGFMYGRFRIIPDSRTGADIVRTHDGRPLASTNEVGNVRPPAFLAASRNLSLDEFVRTIGDKVRTQAAGR